MMSRELDTSEFLWIQLRRVIGFVLVIAPSFIGQAVIAQDDNKPQASNAAPLTPFFSVATIKPNNLHDGRFRLRFTSSGYSAMGVSVRQLIQEAYGILEEDRISGAGGWVESQKYDLEAKVDDADIEALHNLDLNNRRLMLQALLADRFRLTVHTETMERPIYALIVAKNGLRIQETKAENVPTGRMQGFGGNVTRSRPGQLTAEWFTMEGLAQLLTRQLGRSVVDKTGLTGHYDLRLDWTPDQGPVRSVVASDKTATPPDESGPSIFTAVQEQLGLKLEAQKGPVNVLVIDHIEPPSPN